MASRARVVLASVVAVVAFGALGALVSSSARAGELQVGAGVAIRKPSWRGDLAGGGHLGGGYRFARVFALDVLVWEELARVDTRLNTGLTLGITGALPLRTVRPTLRAYFVHQHEEGWVSVAESPLGVLAGIGDGIRHRAGFGARLGVEIPFDRTGRRKQVEWVALGGFEGTWFPDSSLGPAAYYGVTAGVGLNYGLEDLP